jgi:protein-S-isoprenylcysteine O-methyltransferase Ste14
MGAGRSEFAARGGWWVVAQAPVMLGAVLVPLLWGARSFDGTNAIQVAGATVTALGVLLGLAGLVTLGRALTPFPRPLARAQLRQSGIYGLVRHPIYGGVVLASLGWSLTWLSLPGLAAASSFSFLRSQERFRGAAAPGRFRITPLYGAGGQLIPWIY